MEQFKFLKSILWLTQLGLSIVAPPVLCIYGAVWLKDRFGLGSWIVIVGIVLGIGGAASSLWSSLKAMLKDTSSEDDGKDKPVSFNDHE